MTLDCFGANYLVFITSFINSDISKSEPQRFQGSMAHFQHRVQLAAAWESRTAAKLFVPTLYQSIDFLETETIMKALA